jgi:hypothetical protein
MFVDYVMNGQGHGEVGAQLAGCGFEPNLLRPYINDDGVKCVTVNTGSFDTEGNPEYEERTVSEMVNNGVHIPVANATSLRKDEWLKLDTVILKAARQRLRAWNDLNENVEAFGGFNGMSKMILEHETMNDPGEAIVDFDGLSEGRVDAPRMQLEGLPLPITHSSFYFSSRRLAVSRNTGTPLDTTMAEAAARRVAESIEKTLIGVQTGPTYGVAADYNNTPTVRGYLNHPDRTTKTDLNTPTGSNGEDVMTDVLEMIDLAYTDDHYGPYMLYHSTDYSQYMDNLFSTTEPSAGTLRNRLREIDDVIDVRRLDYLPSSSNPFTLLLVQMTSDVVRAVNGMDITTVQWETQGGMQVNFKVMAIQVPQIRSDYNSKSGIVHATTS